MPGLVHRRRPPLPLLRPTPRLLPPLRRFRQSQLRKLLMRYCLYYLCYRVLYETFLLDRPYSPLCVIHALVDRSSKCTCILPIGIGLEMICFYLRSVLGACGRKWYLCDGGREGYFLMVWFRYVTYLQSVIIPHTSSTCSAIVCNYETSVVVGHVFRPIADFASPRDAEATSATPHAVCEDEGLPSSGSTRSPASAHPLIGS